MRLFLASEVKNPPTFKKLTEYIGKFKGKKIAYIPTAANGQGWESWKTGGSWELSQSLSADISLILLEDYWNKDVASQLEGKDVIWFAGGQPGYLLYWIRRTQIDKHIKRILDSGTLYVGSSAGSMIAGKSDEVTEWYEGENEHGANAIPTLNLVDFDIYPHFRDEQLEYIKKHYKGNKLYLLKDGEEIIVEDEKIMVIGEERIVLGKK
ncbi:MAG: Type 1 glutamine amidotransferase-like domain-containing protein [Candidatus Levybacteria bacterium]|nr:Type 1 glutamine amidotransferase-like domain-containing protein [Candidatus Levybacteria bacterium]